MDVEKTGRKEKVETEESGKLLTRRAGIRRNDAGTAEMASFSSFLKSRGNSQNAGLRLGSGTSGVEICVSGTTGRTDLS